MPSFANIEILGHVGREPEQRMAPCEQCGTLFIPDTWERRRGYARFCSVPCSRIHRRETSNPVGRFMRSFKVDVSNDACWEWSGPRIPSGYGAIRVQGKQLKAHRYAWELFYGPIPDGLHVLHRCDNPPCVNPKHLFLGTNLDNIADKVAKGRQSRGKRAERRVA